MFTKEQEKEILDLFNNQTKYKTKEEFLLALREHLTKSMPKDKKETKVR